MTAPATYPGRLTTVLVNQFDFTKQFDSLSRDSMVDVADVTTFGNTSHIRAPHNLDAKVDLTGFYDGATSSSFNRVMEQLLGTYAVITTSREGNVAGASADLISGIISNDNAEAKSTDMVKTKLTVDVSNPVNTVSKPLTVLGYDVPSQNFGKLIYPLTATAGTSGASVFTSAVNITAPTVPTTGFQAAAHLHVTAIGTFSTLDIAIQYSFDNLTWNTAVTLPTVGTTTTSLRAAFTVPVSTNAGNYYFRLQYKINTTNSYTFAVAVALGSGY